MRLWARYFHGFKPFVQNDGNVLMLVSLFENLCEYCIVKKRIFHVFKTNILPINIR